MKKLGLVLGAAAVVTLAGCKDPNFKRSRVSSSDEVKKVTVEETQKTTTITVEEKETPVVSKENAAVKEVVEQKSAPEVVPPPPVVEETTTYVVQPGDSLSKISKKYNIKIASIKELNDLKSDKILVGQKIKLPGKVEVEKVDSRRMPPKPTKAFKKYEGATTKYTVKPGDQLGKIAYAHGISVRQLKEMNNLSTDLIRVNQTLKVPLNVQKKGDNKVKPDKIQPVIDPQSNKTDDLIPVPPVEKGNGDATKIADVPVGPADGNADVSPVTPVDNKVPATDSLYKIYQVKENETVNDIAAAWGLVPNAIREINNLPEDGEVQAGQIINLPASATQE